MKNIITLILFVSISLLAFKFKFSDPAVVFLKALDKDQLEKAQLSFEDLTRTDWHFLPGAMWPRAGVQLAELNPSQKELCFKLLKSHLSEEGYEKVLRIIDLENVLAEISGNTDFRDPEKYNIVFYGDPANDEKWAWSFEGHHISLQFTIVGDNISYTPRFLGASPAIIKEGERKGERTLFEEEDVGLKLINALNPDQKKKAIFQNESIIDIVTANASEVSPLKSVGIKAGALNQEQQQILKELLHVYLSSLPEASAAKRHENLKNEEFGEIYFGWAGAVKIDEPHYYRIQGKSFLIEFDNTQSNANHIHTVWRDFEGDFGRDIIREHYQNSDHH
jgi:hypothetical protein